MTVPPCKDCPGDCASHRCLAAYAPDQAAMSAALDKIEPTRKLTVLTMDPELPLSNPCKGGYLCDCPECVASKVAPIKQVRQPWDVRRAA